jgi:diguanylate cyclase (GGDEF)-like protein
MRKWFAIPTLLQSILTIGIIGFFLIQSSINSSQLILKELQDQMLRQVNDQLSLRLQVAMQLNQINHDSFQYGILNLNSQAERERYFVNHLKSYPDVAMTYIGLEDGSFYGARRIADGEIQVARNNSSTNGASLYYRTSSSGEGIELADQFPDFDPRKRPWYLKTAEVGTPAFSSVYSHFVFHEPSITASYPVYDQDHQMIGVFGVDYLLSWLGDTLRSLPIGASGQVFITDDSGMLVAASADIDTYKIVDGTSKLILETEIDNDLIQTALSLPEDSDKDGLSTFNIEGKKYYLGCSDFQDYGIKWNVYVISAEDDFLGEVREAMADTAIVLIISFLFSIFFTAWIAGRVTKPIVSLSIAAEELANGKLMPIPDDGRKDELGKLTRSFNKMALQLTNVVANLEEEVSMRTQELKESNKVLKQLSFSDGLTGIANRRKFDEAIQSAWYTALRHDRPIALLMLDIDFFKDYNDSYGHNAGDECLKEIGKLMHEKARRITDLAARYGGEEFVILLQDIETDNLADYAEEIRKSIEELNIEHTASPFKRVTVSIGCSYMVPAADTMPTVLIETADQALYRAKGNGRNNSVLSGN